VHDLSLYLLELLENSIRAEATHISVGFFADHASDRLRLTVEDDGRGLQIDPEKALDPFYTTKKDKKTGLGLSLLRAEAETADGHLSIGKSPKSSGVLVEVEMVLTHVDRTPVGDIAKTITLMEVTNPDITFTVSLTGDDFDPPVIDGALDTARGPLKRATQHLDQVVVDEQQEAKRD
jgi:signal transduction histidine kinase